MLYFESSQSPRIFKSDWLDVFTRTHWTVIPALFVPITLFFAGWSVWQAGVSIPVTAILFAVGFTAWTLSEYWLHRTVFHWEPPGKIGETFHFFVHGVHHTWPSDPYRLVMPPWVNLSLLFLLVAPVSLLIAPSWGWGWLSGFVCGYMFYDTMHYWLHHGRFKWGWFKRLKAHHMNHHHNRPDRKFGVSFMVWDRVFRTLT